MELFMYPILLILVIEKYKLTFKKLVTSLEGLNLPMLFQNEAKLTILE